MQTKELKRAYEKPDMRVYILKQKPRLLAVSEQDPVSPVNPNQPYMPQ